MAKHQVNQSAGCPKGIRRASEGYPKGIRRVSGGVNGLLEPGREAFQRVRGRILTLPP